MKRKNALYLCQAAVIAAMYVILTYISALMGLSSGAIQIRISEALCVLPIFMPSAIPGLAVGCLIANILTGSVVLDVIFGSIATLIGALGTYVLRKHRYAAFLPPIVSNMLIVPLVLRYAYHLTEAYPYLVLTVGIGEVISVGVLGYVLKLAIEKRNIRL